MSFSDTVFLFFLALILFGPKKLPEMARHAGRLLAELRRASNEFKSQIETEIAHLEVQKAAQKEAQKPAEKKESDVGPISSSWGSEASLSANPAVGETIPHQTESPATFADPGGQATSQPGTVAPASSSTESVAEPSDSTSQASHV